MQHNHNTPIFGFFFIFFAPMAAAMTVNAARDQDSERSDGAAHSNTHTTLTRRTATLTKKRMRNAEKRKEKRDPMNIGGKTIV